MRMSSDELWAEQGDTTEHYKDEYLRFYVFGTLNAELQKCCAQKTSTTSRRGALALKYVSDKVTDTGKESVQNIEEELKNLHLRDNDYDV